MEQLLVRRVAEPAQAEYLKGLSNSLVAHIASPRDQGYLAKYAPLG